MQLKQAQLTQLNSASCIVEHSEIGCGAYGRSAEGAQGVVGGGGGVGRGEVHLGLMLGPNEGSRPMVATPNRALDTASTTSACKCEQAQLKAVGAPHCKYSFYLQTECECYVIAGKTLRLSLFTQ